MKFSERYLISCHDEDMRGILKPSSALRYMQECVNSQMREMGPSNDELRREGKGFLLSRVYTEILEPLYAGDAIEAQTWSCGQKGFRFFRCHQLLKDGNVVARTYSVWALIDINEGKLLRTTEFRAGFDDDPPFATDALAEPFAVPHTEEMELAGTHRVCYAEADVNRHMNNTEYPDMLCDHINLDGKRVSYFAINFQNEAPLGETLSVYRKTAEDGSILMRTVRADGKTNIEAKVLLCDCAPKFN